MNEMKAEHKAQVTITPQLSSQISCLHNQCPSATEWSGVLIYEITGGGIDDLENLKIKAHAVFPMNFGTGAYTEYEGTPDMLKIFEIFPQVDPVAKDPAWFIGHIHSHHSMTTFFSGTDTSELLTNVQNLPIYLSLIVNYACAPCAKIAIVAETEETNISFTRWVLRGSNKKNKKKEIITAKSKPAYVIECDVLFSESEWFISQLKSVKTKSEVPKYNTYAGGKSQMGFGYNGYPKDYSSNNTYNKPLKGNKPWVYQMAIKKLADLFTLGECQDITAYAALQLANVHTDMNEREKYRNAFKYYFEDTWFDETFYQRSDVTATDALDAIAEFLTYHKDWISVVLNEAIKELRDELPILQSV